MHKHVKGVNVYHPLSSKPGQFKKWSDWYYHDIDYSEKVLVIGSYWYLITALDVDITFGVLLSNLC